MSQCSWLTFALSLTFILTWVFGWHLTSELVDFVVLDGLLKRDAHEQRQAEGETSDVTAKQLRFEELSYQRRHRRYQVWVYLTLFVAVMLFSVYTPGVAC